MLHGLQHLAVPYLGVGEDLLQVVDVSPRDAVGVQRLAQLLDLPVREPLAQQRAQLLEVREPAGIGRELGPAVPVRAHQLAKRRELRVVANGVNKLRKSDNATILITHYQRLLDYIVPDYVHVLYKGRIVKTGGKELALELEEKGYDWIKQEFED